MRDARFFPESGRLKTAMRALRTLSGRLKTVCSFLKGAAGQMKTVMRALQAACGQLKTARYALQGGISQLQESGSRLNEPIGQLNGYWRGLNEARSRLNEGASLLDGISGPLKSGLMELQHGRSGFSSHKSALHDSGGRLQIPPGLFSKLVNRGEMPGTGRQIEIRQDSPYSAAVLRSVRAETFDESKGGRSSAFIFYWD